MPGCFGDVLSVARRQSHVEIWPHDGRLGEVGAERRNPILRFELAQQHVLARSTATQSGSRIASHVQHPLHLAIRRHKPRVPILGDGKYGVRMLLSGSSPACCQETELRWQANSEAHKSSHDRILDMSAERVTEMLRHQRDTLTCASSARLSTFRSCRTLSRKARVSTGSASL